MKKIILNSKRQVEEILIEDISNKNIVAGVAGAPPEFVRIVAHRKRFGFTLVDMFMGEIEEPWHNTLRELIQCYPEWNWYSFNDMNDFCSSILENHWTYKL